MTRKISTAAVVRATAGRSGTRKLLTRAAIVIATLGVALFGLQALPAAASTPQCTQAALGTADDAHGFRDVPIADSGTGNCWMARGDFSGGVWALQRSLVYCYGKNIAIDSDFGPRTQAALRDVQASLQISRDGVYGPQTRGAILFASTGQDFYNPNVCAHWR